jgi:hypothetical protein
MIRLKMKRILDKMTRNTHHDKRGLSDTYQSKLNEYPNKKIDRNFVLDTIRKNSPLSIYHLKEITEIGYSTLWGIVREFEFAGLVKTKNVTNKENREEKIITIPKTRGNDETKN